MVADRNKGTCSGAINTGDEARISKRRRTREADDRDFGKGVDQGASELDGWACWHVIHGPQGGEGGRPEEAGGEPVTEGLGIMVDSGLVLGGMREAGGESGVVRGPVGFLLGLFWDFIKTQLFRRELKLS
ncbi:hypothetical protein F0562_034542 [Nyssa sinensis]|uniref:Uncharacterized protein n=1 Tax=Nyssa sinensis TaxID=561372 RepID=A0A5J5AG76_9ASTE|nr:hypothetical protein F0562_034542 [Nyssa sinensis]